jgi:WD40 repeat protein
VAIKVILSGQFASKQEVLRFRCEAEAAANLRHPNIVAIYETGECEGQHYFSMDYVAGRNLAEIVYDGPLASQRAARYVKIIAEAVHYAHQHGVLHRDLKPSNVLIDADDQPRLTDFGLAKRLHGDFGVTVTGQVLGSPSFMPPEQTSGKSSQVGPPGDVYGLGAILYHLITGQPPFRAETIPEILYQLHQREPVAPRLLNSSVPRDLETICLKCLEKAPEKRYATAQELAEELGRFERGEPILARPTGRPEKVWRWCRREPALATLILVVQLVVAGGVAGILWQWRRAEHQRIESEQNLYVQNIHGAFEALHDNHMARARQLLKNIDQSADQRAARCWEERYLTVRARGDQLMILGRSTAPLAGLATSPDGQWLACIAEDGQVRLWDFPARRETNSWSAHFNVVESNPSDLLHDLVFTPDSQTLITCGVDKRIRLWEVPSGRLQSEFTNLPQRAVCPVISPQRKLLATGNSSGQLTLWSLTNNPPTPLHTWETGLQVLASLASSADGSVLFVGGPTAQPVQLYDTSSPGDPRRLPDLDDTDFPVAVSHDGRLLATASGDELRVRLFALPSLNPVLTAPSRGSQLDALAFSPDDQVLAAGFSDGGITLYDLGKTNQSVTLLGHEDTHLLRLRFSRDGRTLASVGYDNTVRLWDASVAERGAWSFPQIGNAEAVSFSPDSTRLLVTTQTTLASGTNLPQRNLTTRLWDLDPEKGLMPIADRCNPMAGLSSFATFSPDGSIAAVSDDGRSRFLQVPSLAPIAQVEGRLPCFGPGGQWLVYATGGDPSCIWRADSPKESATVLARTKGWISALALSPKERVVASCATGGGLEILLWDADDGRLLGELKGHKAFVRCLAFSPDGKTLASAGWDDGLLGMWNMSGLRDSRRSQQRRLTLLPAHGGVYQVAFSPDGRTIASCGNDETVRLWSVARLQELAVLRGHRSKVNGVCFSPDGRWLASASDDHTIRLWLAPSESELASSAGSK